MSKMIFSSARVIVNLLVIFAASQVIADPQMWYQYSSGIGIPKIVAVNGATELSITTNDCSPDIIAGTIANVDFQRGRSVPEGFNMRQPDGLVEFINIDELYIEKLDKVGVEWLTILLTPKNQVLVSVSRCGASGRTLVARDIYKTEQIKHLIKQ